MADNQITVREIVFNATAIHLQRGNMLVESGGTKKDNAGKILRGLDAGRVISAMERLPAPMREWCWFCNSAFYKASDATEFAERLIWKYRQHHRKDRKRNLRELADLVMLDMRKRVWTYQPQFTAQELALCLEVSKQSWFGTWFPKFKYMSGIVAKWDHRSIHDMGDAIYLIRRGEYGKSE